MQPHHISPRHTTASFCIPLSLDDKITVFEARTLGWQIDVADLLINGSPNVQRNPDAGFAVLAILASYFEMIGKLQDGYTGTDKSRKYFRRGMLSVFPELVQNTAVADSLFDLLYHSVRCGLYHMGMTGAGVLLSGDFQHLVALRNDGLLEINPLLLPAHLRQHVRNYVARLRDSGNADLRANFERTFDQV